MESLIIKDENRTKDCYEPMAVGNKPIKLDYVSTFAFAYRFPATALAQVKIVDIIIIM